MMDPWQPCLSGLFSPTTKARLFQGLYPISCHFLRSLHLDWWEWELSLCRLWELCSEVLSVHSFPCLAYCTDHFSAKDSKVWSSPALSIQRPPLSYSTSQVLATSRSKNSCFCFFTIATLPGSIWVPLPCCCVETTHQQWTVTTVWTCLLPFSQESESCAARRLVLRGHGTHLDSCCVWRGLQFLEWWLLERGGRRFTHCSLFTLYPSVLMPVLKQLYLFCILSKSILHWNATEGGHGGRIGSLSATHLAASVITTVVLSSNF